MKKLISLILLFILSLGAFCEKAFSNNDRYFVVTAYYSPLPDQNYYLRGNYEAEKRLNGQGIAGASGKKVFSGMLAAPKNYQFGTKIYLEGLGIGSVEDRGGAIVNAGNRGYSHDRIDVWMGHGDEGLRRALHWGKRTVKGSILSSQTDTNLDFTVIDSPFWVTNSLEQDPEIFSKSIGVKSSLDDIYELKEFLIYSNFYDGELNGIYSNDLINRIYEFQKENNLVDPNYIESHGYWGKSTREKVLNLYKKGKLQASIQQENNEVFLGSTNNDMQEISIQEDSILNNHNNIILKGDINYIFNNPVKSITHIAELQNIFYQLDLYNGEIDGKYNSIKEVVLKYQLDNNIITSENDIGSGYYGPKTRKMLYQDYTNYLFFKYELLSLKNKIQKQKDLYTTDISKKLKKYDNINFGDVSQTVRDFQLLLSDLGYFDYKDTAIFGEITKNAIISMQLDLGVINKNDDIGAGIFGKNTQKELHKFLVNKNVKNYISSLELKEKYLEELKKSGIIL